MPLLDVRHLGCHPDPEHNVLLHSYVGVARAGLGGVTPAERQRTENLCVYFLAIQPRRPHCSVLEAHSTTTASPRVDAHQQQQKQKQENLFLYRSSQPNPLASDLACNSTIDHQSKESVGGHSPPRSAGGSSRRRDGWASQEEHEEELQAIRWYQRVRTVQVEDSWLLQADGSFATSLPVLPGPSSSSNFSLAPVPLDALSRTSHSSSSSLPTVATVWSLFECFDHHRLSLTQFFQRIDTAPLMFRHLSNTPELAVGGGRADGTNRVETGLATAASPQAATSTPPRLFAASVVPLTEAVHIVAPWVLLKPITRTHKSQGPSSSSTLPAEPHHSPTDLLPLADGAAVGLIPLGKNDPLLQYSLAWLVQTQPKIHKEYLALRQQLERFHSTLHREVEQQQKKLQSQRAAYEAQLAEMNRMVDELQESLLKKEQQKSSRLLAEDAWLHSHASPVRTHHQQQPQPRLEDDENDGDDDVELEDEGDDNDGMGTHDFTLDSYQPFERRGGGGKRIPSHPHHHQPVKYLVQTPDLTWSSSSNGAEERAPQLEEMHLALLSLREQQQHRHVSSSHAPRDGKRPATAPSPQHPRQSHSLSHAVLLRESTEEKVDPLNLSGTSSQFFYAQPQQQQQHIPPHGATVMVQREGKTTTVNGHEENPLRKWGWRFVS